MTRWCGLSGQHPPHSWITGRESHYCPGGPIWTEVPVGPAPPLEPMFCRHCGKHLRAEQGAYAATDPNDGAPWRCARDPREGKRHQP